MNALKGGHDKAAKILRNNGARPDIKAMLFFNIHHAPVDTITSKKDKTMRYKMLSMHACHLYLGPKFYFKA